MGIDKDIDSVIDVDIDADIDIAQGHHDYFSFPSAFGSRATGVSQFDLTPARLRVSQLGVVRDSLSRPRSSYRFHHRVPTSFRPLEAVFSASRRVRGWLGCRDGFVLSHDSCGLFEC